MGKKNYEKMLLSVIRFEEADVITLSENDYDNLGGIGGWNPGWDFDWTDLTGKGGNA